MAVAPLTLTDALRDRFTVERELGRGGMATVYLARDLRHDRLVALKVLHPEVATALGGARFQREIEIAARLHHPLIVPVFDSGATPEACAAPSSLWYAMPFVEGQSLRQRLQREKQLPLEEAVRIACEVAEALAYAHSRGVVHRDVKPENILMSRGHALLADFGIARPLSVASEDRLTETGLSLGTPTYMSPEQAAGDDRLDCRSDLYSLGCVLYEMLAGQPPFTGSSPRAVLARHAIDPVPSLRTVRPTVPAGLEAAIRRALCKVPADRFTSAADFAEMVKQAVRASPAEEFPPAEVTRPVGWRQANETPAVPLVGRTAEQRRLVRAWVEAQHGSPRCVLLSGVAGIGKTRLAEEFVRWADQQGAAIATSCCYGSVGRLPYAPLADWLRSPALRRSVSTLPEVWQAEVARLVPEIGAQASETRRDLSPPEARRRLFEAIVRTMAAAPQPLLLWLDDIQWADRDTLEWIGYFLRTKEPYWVLVLTTLRLGEVPLEDRLEAILLDLRREGCLEEISLEPLDSSHAAALAAAVAGSTLEPAAARELHRETEGHPLYIVEMMRAKLAGANTTVPVALRKSEEQVSTGRLARRSLPQRVLATIEARLAQLSPMARTTIGVAAVIGREFQMDLLAESSGISENDTASALDELLERRLVREQSGGSYDFSHDNIREVAYGGLGSARRRLLHHRIAEAQIAAAGGSKASAAGIAKHLEQGGFLQEAIPYYRQAAEHARDLYASAEAVRHFDTALELLKQLPSSRARLAEEIELRTALCAVLVGLEMYGGPRVTKEHACLRSLCDQAGITPAAPLLRSFAHPLIMRGAMSEVAEIGARLLAAVPVGGDPILPVEAHYLLGVATHWRGDPRAAAVHFQAALEAYRPDYAWEHIRTYGQDPAAVCGVRLALALTVLDRRVEARRAFDDALARAESLAHPNSLAYTRTFGIYIQLLLGDEAGIGRLLDGALEVAKANALRGWCILNKGLKGYTMAREGQVGRGIELMQSAAEEWAGYGFKLHVPQHCALLAETYLRAGRLDDAGRALDEGADVARETDLAYWDAELLRLRGRLFLSMGGPVDEVRRVLHEAIGIAGQQGAPALQRRAEQDLQELRQKVDASGT